MQFILYFFYFSYFLYYFFLYYFLLLFLIFPSSCISSPMFSISHNSCLFLHLLYVLLPAYPCPSLLTLVFPSYNSCITSRLSWPSLFFVISGCYSFLLIFTSSPFFFCLYVYFFHIILACYLLLFLLVLLFIIFACTYFLFRILALYFVFPALLFPFITACISLL